jgi:hypothetical protein
MQYQHFNLRAFCNKYLTGRHAPINKLDLIADFQTPEKPVCTH